MAPGGGSSKNNGATLRCDQWHAVSGGLALGATWQAGKKTGAVVQ